MFPSPFYSSHYKSIIRLGLPIVVGQLGIIIAGFADTWMVGHHSAHELAAASFVNNVFNFVIIFSTGFSYGLTPLVGSLFGQGKTEKIAEMLKNGILANTLLGILLFVASFILYLNVHRLGLPNELLPEIRPYFVVILMSILFVVPFNAFKQFADGITDTQTGMWIMIAGNALNIILNYLLIFGKCGLPEMGLLGAGIATLITRAGMLLAFVILFFFTRRYASYSSCFNKTMIRKSTLIQQTRMGFPLSIQLGLECISFSFSAIMMGWLGAAALAAHQILCTVGTLCYLFYYGVGAAIAIRVSTFFGQRNLLEARRVAYAGFHLMFLSAILFITLIYLFRGEFSNWFTSDKEVDIIVSALIAPFMLYQFGDALQVTYANSLRGLTDVKSMMWIAVVAYLVVLLPLGYFLGFVLGYGAQGIWMAFPVGLTTAGWLFFLRFRKKTKLS